MGKAKKQKKIKPKDEPLKIYGSFEDVIGLSVSGNPRPKEKKEPKKK